MSYQLNDPKLTPGDLTPGDRGRPLLLAVATDAGWDIHSGWITLNWEIEPGGLARDNDGDSSGIKEATLRVSKIRALQAMSALARYELVV